MPNAQWSTGLAPPPMQEPSGNSTPSYMPAIPQTYPSTQPDPSIHASSLNSNGGPLVENSSNVARQSPLSSPFQSMGPGSGGLVAPPVSGALAPTANHLGGPG